MAGGLGDTGMEPSLGGDEQGLDMDAIADEPVDNIPAAAGPENEPLGRAPVEV
jgi:hypothetical protein